MKVEKRVQGERSRDKLNKTVDEKDWIVTVTEYSLFTTAIAG